MKKYLFLTAVRLFDQILLVELQMRSMQESWSKSCQNHLKVKVEVKGQCFTVSFKFLAT